jgi:hypothetical protein
LKTVCYHVSSIHTYRKEFDMTAITDSYITRVAKGILSGESDAETGRASYLRALIEDAQGKIEKGAELKAQVESINGTHERFYRIVLAVVSESVPRAQKGRAAELQRRANFARTAKSILMRNVKSGNDLATIKADKATKRSLTVASQPREPKPLTPEALKAQVEAQSHALVASIVGLTALNPVAAATEINLIVGMLQDQLTSMGVASTKSASVAIAKHRPLQVGKIPELFMPTPTSARKRMDGSAIPV